MCRANDHQKDPRDSPRHRVLIVGVGSIGERHQRCFLKTNRAKVLFVDTNPSLSNSVALRYPDAIAVADLDSAIDGQATLAILKSTRENGWMRVASAPISEVVER